MAGFQFKFTPPAASSAPSPAPQQPAPSPADAQRQQIIMEQAFARGGNVELAERSEYEKPGLYLERIEDVKFVTSQNRGNGNAGQSFVISKRTIIRVLDTAQGQADSVGATTVSRYKLSLDPAYASCVGMMSKLADVPHKSLTPADMARACMPDQMFAGVCAIVHRFFLPPKEGKSPFLTVVYKARIDADDLLTGLTPNMGGPLTQAEKDRFWSGKDPVDPFWITADKAERWARAQGAALPSAEERAAMTPEQTADYYDQIVGAYTESKAKPKAQ